MDYHWRFGAAYCRLTRDAHRDIGSNTYSRQELSKAVMHYHEAIAAKDTAANQRHSQLDMPRGVAEIARPASDAFRDAFL